jgi:hypothetical protein
MRPRSKARRPQRPGNCLYRCDACGAQERIYAEVLAFFYAVDPGEPGAPATFRCERWPGIMSREWWFRAKRAAP